MCLSSPSETLILTKLGVKKVSSDVEVLAEVGDTWSAGICKKV
jgi:hypothetical protein